MITNEQLDYLAARIAELLKPDPAKAHMTKVRVGVDNLQRAAYSIPEFCGIIGMSRGAYYLLKNRGEGPDLMRVGNRIMISKESADKWIKDRSRDK